MFIKNASNMKIYLKTRVDVDGTLLKSEYLF